MIVTVSGALASVAYGYEAVAFQTKSAAINKTFGLGSKITSLERNNNLEIIYGLGDREAVVNLEKQFGGTVSVETVMSDPWIMKAILGDTFTSNNSTTGKQTTTLNGAHSLGATTLTLTDATGFADGEHVKIAGGNANTFEIRKQVGAPSANVITIDKPLYYSHPTLSVVSEINGSGPTTYYHTFRNSNTTQLNTLTIENSVDLDTDYTVDLLGCVPTGSTFGFSVNDAVTATYDFAFGKEDEPGTFTFVPQIASTFNPYTFAYGNLYFPGSGTSAMANVQSCEITATPNIDLVYGLGNRQAGAYVNKNMEYSISASVYFLDKTVLQSMFLDGTNVYPTGGPGTTVAQNGLVLHANDGTNSFVFSFGGVKIDTTSLNQDPTAPIFEDVSIKARNLTVYALNTVSAIP